MALGEPVDSNLGVGATVAVLREVWPNYECLELGGQAWRAVVKARSAGAATVQFTHATTASGRQYGEARLALQVLRHIAPATTAQ